jgi:hypothetical protein
MVAAAIKLFYGTVFGGVRVYAVAEKA